MCGITGGFGVRMDAAVLAAMNRSLAHRGPDDEGLRLDDNAGLAMRRLKIIDLTGGHQPLCNEDQTVWTVFNGEIYNFQSLRKDLIAKGHRFASETDSEVIVHLYEEKQEALVHDLKGMFAFAVWDKTRQKMLLARDTAGIKPLFYSHKDGALLFASEMKALLRHPEVSQELDWLALNDYLSFLYVPAPRTIYRDIRKLEPGCTLIADAKGMRIQRFRDIDLPAEAPLKSEREYVQELRALAQQAVQSHMISDVPVGSFLSGGVDSSIVTALAARQTGPGLHTFSVGFDAVSHDETSYARLVAGHLKTEHHELRLDASALDCLPAVVACFDEPFGDSSAIPTYLLSRFARQTVTVALAGDGGDELFGGYEWMRRQRWIDGLRIFPRAWLGMASDMLGGDGRRYEMQEGRQAGLARLLRDASMEDSRAFFRRSTCMTEHLKREVLLPDAQSAMHGYDPFEMFSDLLKPAQQYGIYEQMLRWDTKVYLPDDVLCKVDRASMAHGLEVRVPVLDLPLIAFSAQLPFAMKLNGMTSKYIWKKAFADMLPARIFRQRKQGFSVPVQRWMRAQVPALRRLLLDKESFCRGIFREEAIKSMLDRQESGRFRLGGPLYLLLVLELWSKGTHAPCAWKELAAA